MPLDDDARARGRRNRKTVRTVAPDQVPGGKPPETLDDAVTWASWLAFQIVTGELDPATVREANRSITTLKDAIHKRDLMARIRTLEKQVRELERGHG